ncbi:21898_t:CDS:1, partial [Gigaspora margarita]
KFVGRREKSVNNSNQKKPCNVPITVVKLGRREKSVDNSNQ